MNERVYTHTHVELNEEDSSSTSSATRCARARARVFNLTKWFNWRSADMAVHYTQSVDMAKAMGIPEIP